MISKLLRNNFVVNVFTIILKCMVSNSFCCDKSNASKHFDYWFSRSSFKIDSMCMYLDIVV